MAGNLARTSDALSITSGQSWTRTLNGILTATAQMTRKQLTSDELSLWERLLANFQLEGIQWAFTEYLRTGRFFPMPAEITDLYSAWRLKQIQRQRDELARHDREETERRRAAGGVLDLAEIHEIIRDQVATVAKRKAFPAPDPNRRALAQAQKIRIMRAIENVGKPRRI